MAIRVNLQPSRFVPKDQQGLADGAVLLYRPLRSEELLAVVRIMRERLAAAGVSMDDAEKGKITTAQGMELADILAAVRLLLVGWDNVLDEDGNAVEFPTERGSVFDLPARDIAAQSVIDTLGTKYCAELFKHVAEEMTAGLDPEGKGR